MRNSVTNWSDFQQLAKTWAKAMEKATPVQLYSYGRRQQNAKKSSREGQLAKKGHAVV